MAEDSGQQNDITLRIMQAMPEKDFNQLWLLLEELRAIAIQCTESITE